MKDSKLTQLVKRIRDTQADEINCSACLDQISEYVDLEISKMDAAKQMPQVRQHLGQCTVCFEEYQVLRDLALLENDGRTPSEEELAEQLKSSRNQTLND